MAIIIVISVEIREIKAIRKTLDLYVRFLPLVIATNPKKLSLVHRKNPLYIYVSQRLIVLKLIAVNARVQTEFIFVRYNYQLRTSIFANIALVRTRVF